MILMERIMNMLVNVLGAWSVDILELAAAILSSQADHLTTSPLGLPKNGDTPKLFFSTDINEKMMLESTTTVDFLVAMIPIPAFPKMPVLIAAFPKGHGVVGIALHLGYSPCQGSGRRQGHAGAIVVAEVELLGVQCQHHGRRAQEGHPKLLALSKNCWKNQIHENPSMYLSSFPSEQRYMLEVNSNEQNTIKTRKGLVRFSSKVAPTMFTVPGARQHSSGTFCFKDFAKQECKMGVEPQETAHWTKRKSKLSKFPQTS